MQDDARGEFSLGGFRWDRRSCRLPTTRSAVVLVAATVLGGAGCHPADRIRSSGRKLTRSCGADALVRRDPLVARLAVVSVLASIGRANVPPPRRRGCILPSGRSVRSPDRSRLVTNTARAITGSDQCTSRRQTTLYRPNHLKKLVLLKIWRIKRDCSYLPSGALRRSSSEKFSRRSLGSAPCELLLCRRTLAR
jgi:hypothetical protein